MQQSHQTSDAPANASQRNQIAALYVRPLEPSDRAGLAALFTRLSPESRRRRFLGPKPGLSARELTYLTAVDHRSYEAMVAVDCRDGSIAGVARYAAISDRPGAADAALAVADERQRQGIGTALAGRLIHRARANGFEVLTATTLWDNRPARALLRRLGFRPCTSQGNVIELELAL